MLQQCTNPILFVINNAAYTVEVELHDGPYNVLRPWNYARFAEALDDDQGSVHAVRVRRECGKGSRRCWCSGWRLGMLPHLMRSTASR